jgi:cytochrome P450
MTALQHLISVLAAHPLLFVFTLITTYILTTIIRRTYLHPLSPYPGPFLARFTDFYSFYGVAQGKRTRLQYELLQQYGSPMRFSTNELVFSDLSTVTEIYGQSSTLPLKERTIHEALTATGEPSILTIIDPKKHARVRRLLGHAFSSRSVLSYEAVVAAKVELYVNLALRPKRKAEERTSDVYIRTHELFLDIISELSFGEGRGFNSLEDEKSTALADVACFGKVIPPQAFFPGFRYLPVRAIREGFAGVERLVEFARAHVRRCYMRAEKDQRHSETSILRNMFEAKDDEQANEPTLIEREIVENTIIFLVGGTTSSAGTVIYFLWEAGRRPKVMAKLVKEIRSAFPDPDTTPRYEEVANLVSASTSR